MRRDNLFAGIILILFGIIFLLSNFGILDISFQKLWPLFILVPGVVFELAFFTNRKEPGLLVPAGILITTGIVFIITVTFGWNLMDYLWPFFPFGVALGLFQLYLFGDREAALLIPVGIIGGFSLIALSFTLNFWSMDLILSGILILSGLLIIFKRK